ncbi:MAG TPA: glycosyltransferase family 4 protein [Candidatus Krumholzibacteria bacterium]|nr:glycosyltransferase family 4 protein [Candidatus Krumholzibacteria bacterium]HPD70406.1 glycosyltransferase family 4 protein [Candidatus Krumholzibacteria bacterium]HRY39894.1 glycosyltransferase family 4 protein [Candidatus Krumholzibacteria bacterium]
MIAYLTHTYPNYSTTFTRAELDRLDVVAWSVRRPPEAFLTADLRGEIERTRYLRPLGLRRIVAANLRAACGRRAIRWWRTVAELVLAAGPDPVEMVKTKLHVLEAVAWGEQLAAEGCRLVHVQFADSAATYACVVHRVFAIPYTVAVHAHDIFMRRFPRGLSRRRIGEARAIRVISEFNRRWLQERLDIPPDRCAVIRCGVDPGAFSATGPSDDEPPLVLAVGRLVDYKGFRYLLDACGLLRDQGCRFRCRLVGSGPEEAALRRRRDALGLAEVVELVGVVPHGEMAGEFARAAVFVLPCCRGAGGEMDGIPVAMMEAMARGLPVVSTRISGVPELVDDGANGLLVAPEDAAGLASALARVLTDRDLRRRLGGTARQTIVARYDVESNTAALARLLETHR